jgi:hypothetical protein
VRAVVVRETQFPWAIAWLRMFPVSVMQMGLKTEAESVVKVKMG